MKVFIVFFGLLIINISFLTFQGDMGRYVRCQTFLKAVAEECAAGAALYCDEDEYSDGRFQFKYEEGRKYIEYLIEESKKQMPLPRDSILSYQVFFQDDYLGYEIQPDSRAGTGKGQGEGTGKSGAGTGNGPGSGAEHNPSVTVELTAVTGDLFRLPFLEVRQVKRAAKYELPQ